MEIAIAGCGAVASVYYAPALTLLEREGAVRVSALFDPDRAAASRIGASFPAARRVTTFEALLDPAIDLVIVASPPRHHATQAAQALRAGRAVLCEKPLALSTVDAEDVIAAASTSGAVLAVGMVRRLLPATRTIRSLLASGALGSLERIECFEGGPFRWPVHSPAYFDRSTAGGGVLLDIGTHVLDLLTWWLGPPASLRYQDDAMGGVEANCRVRLAWNHAEADVRLSRDWERPNRYLVTGSRGWLSWIANEGHELEMALRGAEYVSKVCLHEPDGRPARNFHQTFLEQIRQVVRAVRGDPAAIVTGADALASVALVERCYRERTPLAMPWLTDAEQEAVA